MLKPYEQLEQKFAEHLETEPEQVVACSSGTAALHLAVECLHDLIDGPVIVPDYTMISCARSVSLAGKECKFVGCRDDLLMDVTGMTSSDSIMLVHIYGRRVREVQCRVLIEDMAELHGEKPYPSTNAACWSFYKNKIIHGEEGGAIWFAEKDRANYARQLRSVGFTHAHDYTHLPRGCNYRLADSLSEKILHSLKNLQNSIRYRRYVEHQFDIILGSLWDMPPRTSPWVYDMRIPGIARKKQKEIVQALNDQGIAARMGFMPMTLQAEYYSPVTTSQETLRAYREVMYLQLNPYLCPLDIARLASQTIEKCL